MSEAIYSFQEWWGSIFEVRMWFMVGIVIAWAFRSILRQELKNQNDQNDQNQNR